MTRYYLFHDMQTGGHSAHHTLDGLVDMLLEDVRDWIGTGEERLEDSQAIKAFEKGKWSEQKKLDYVRGHEYHPEEVTPELLQEYGISKTDFKEFGWQALSPKEDL